MVKSFESKYHVHSETEYNVCNAINLRFIFGSTDSAGGLEKEWDVRNQTLTAFEN